LVAIRLNNRDALREQSSNEHSNLTIKMSTHKSGHAYKYKTGPTTVAVSVHQTITSDLATTPTSEHSYDDALGLEKPVRVLYSVVARQG